MQGWIKQLILIKEREHMKEITKAILLIAMTVGGILSFLFLPFGLAGLIGFYPLQSATNFMLACMFMAGFVALFNLLMKA
jgi:Zn-dependent protease